jgi:hypothetical protein
VTAVTEQGPSFGSCCSDMFLMMTPNGCILPCKSDTIDLGAIGLWQADPRGWK